MEYNILGETDLRISKLSFGASSLGSVFRPVDEDDAIGAVHTALDLGINFIDVSPYYGNTVAETVLGKALEGIDRDTYILATKVGRYGETVFDFSATRVLDSIRESLHRLKLDHIDLIQCHDIEFGNLTQVVNETIPALNEAKSQGLVRYIGVTGYPLTVFDHVTRYAHVDSILSYCRLTLQDTSLLDIAPTMQSLGVGLINASPLSMGLLTKRGAPSWHPASKAIQAACRKASDYCYLHGTDIAKLALQFSVSHAEVATTLVSTASVDHIRSNVKWSEESLDMDILREVLKLLTDVSGENWPSGLPENSRYIP